MGPAARHFLRLPTEAIERMAAASRHVSQEVVGAEEVTLSVQEHIADVMDPVSLAETIKGFLSSHPGYKT